MAQALHISNCGMAGSGAKEPPDPDPQIQWCGIREVNPPGDPIQGDLPDGIATLFTSAPLLHDGSI
jgi:hypothetical protein